MGLNYDDLFSYPLFHSYILEGKSADSEDAVKELSLRIICESKPPCRVCPSCEKVLSGNCSDIKTLERGAGVKEIRDFLSDLWLAPSDGDRKIYIFKDADYLSEYSQNTLLLPIEEPPDGVFFIICCGSSEKILPTVKSRCRRIMLGDKADIDSEEEELCKNFCSLLFRNDFASAVSLLDFKKGERFGTVDFINYFCGYCIRKIRYFAEEKKYSEAGIYSEFLDIGRKWSRRLDSNMNMNLAITGFAYDCRQAAKK